MGFLSRDGNALLGLGPWSVCVQCGEATHEGDEMTRHDSHCPLITPSDAAPTRRVLDPRLYVFTDRGIERAMDVERRRTGR